MGRGQSDSSTEPASAALSSPDHNGEFMVATEPSKVNPTQPKSNTTSQKRLLYTPHAHVRSAIARLLDAGELRGSFYRILGVCGFGIRLSF